MREAIKVVWLEGKITEKRKAFQPRRCDPENLALKPETSLKSAAGLFEVQLEYLETGDTLRFHQ